METEGLPSISSVMKNEYKRQGDVFGKLITDERANMAGLELDDVTKESLGRLPPEDAARVIEFAGIAASFIPDQVFNTLGYHPSNKQALKAMVATAYKFDQPSQDDPSKREMYIRAISATSSEGMFFSNYYATNTDDINDDFLETDFNRQNYMNYLARLTAATMPIAESNPERTKENKDNFDIFYAKTKQRVMVAMDRFSAYYVAQFPDKIGQISTWRDNLVFVDTISRSRLFTNDDEINSESGYGSLSAGAVAYGVDPISGLPLTIIKTPYNYEEVAKNPDLLPKNDPSYKNTLTVVHENTHNANSERQFSGDWNHLINEMLTDSTAWIITLESEGQPFADIPDDYFAMTGYFDLVMLGSNMVRNGIFTTDEMVAFGLNQDPKGFLATLDQRIKGKEDRLKVESVVQYMMRRMLIPPVKTANMAETVDQFKQNPSGFMEQQSMKMWNLLEGQYLGQKYYMVGVFEALRKAHPEIGEKDYGAMRDKDTGILTDDVIDIFYDQVSHKYVRHSYFLPEEKLIELTSSYETGIDFSTLPVPEDMIVTTADQRETFDLLRATNSILKAGLNYKSSNWSDEQRFTAIVDSTQKLYVGVNQVLDKNWRNKGILYSSEPVMANDISTAPQNAVETRGQMVDPSQPVVDGEILENGANTSDYQPMTSVKTVTSNVPGRNDLCPCGSGKKYKKCCYPKFG